ncbi:DUF2314 domain-containing protein [Thiobacillus sp.]
MRFLLDTNILIPLEDSKRPLLPSLANFVRLANANGHTLIYHPASEDDIRQDVDVDRRNQTLARLGQYTPLDVRPACPWSAGVVNRNDAADNEILYALHLNAAHALVTEDQGIHSKAKARGLVHRVYTIQTAEDLLQRLHARVPVQLPNIEDVPLYSLTPHLHAYNDGEYVRAISLGMAKFGLPDVVIENFSWSLNRNMGHLINAFGQSMAEGRQIASAGEYELNFRAIKDRAVRDDYVKSLKPNGTAVAHLTLMQGLPEEGDPQNRLIEIAFEKYPGVDVHAQQDAMISSLFGWEETIKRIRHNEALNAASKRAKARLPALRKAFANGLAPGEYIQVKAPFDTPDNSKEWMWVEITEWNGARIKGLLKNEPVATPGLHGGQIVQVREKDVFDYIRHYPNGKEEGNETSTIIFKMQGSVERQE